VPPPGIKVIVSENGRKVVIYTINNSNSDSELSIGPYSPDSDYSSNSNVEELVYQELVECMDREYRG
jgi:endo-beta-N-acetylglucosaminidase D